MQRKKTDQILYILSFLITAIILFIAFALNGIYPGSEKSILIYDMGAQYVSFYSYLYHLGEGYNSIMYQTLSALGGGYYGTWAYYTASPLSFFVLLFDPSDLQDAIYFLTLIKISLSAVSFVVFIRNGRFKDLGFVPSLAGSVAYSLMAYNITYSMSLMWIDGVIMLPIVILGVENIFFEKRRVLFCISLAFSIIFNYYTGYMIIIFAVVYYLYLSISYNSERKQVLCKGLMIFVCGLISCLIASFILLPVMFDLAEGRLNEDAKVMFGLMRNPFGVIRQLLPFSYGGFSSDGYPSVYCGILVTASIVFFFAGKKIQKKKKLAGLLVFSIFVISFCIDAADMLWHGMQLPVSFPARYSFVFSFFLIVVFLETADRLFMDHAPERVGNIILYVILLFAFADLGFNSYYLIRSLDNDPDTGGYLKTLRYEYYYNIYDELKSHPADADTRIVSDLDCSSDDGLMFGISSLDYFSSSYSNRLSDFYKNLGLNTVRHNFEDTGLNPLSASLLGVDYYVPFLSEYSEEDYRPDLTECFIQAELYEDFDIYVNQNSLSLIAPINQFESTEFTANVFENLNRYCRDLTGIDDVFVKADEETVRNEQIDDGTLFKRTFIIRPLSGKHLYFYVSPEDYEEGEGICYDYVFLGDRLIASYENIGYRYIVDMGVSDGSEVEFTFVSYSGNSDIWFYSLDDSAYCEAMDALNNNFCSTVYSRQGIESDIKTAEETDLLVLLPYEKGYRITVDGIKTDYGNYRDSLIKIRVPEGDHHIVIRYYPEGLFIGIILSFLGLSVLFFMEKILRKNN